MTREHGLIKPGAKTALERTPGGLLVPEGVLEKRQRTLLREHVVKHSRSVRTMNAEGIGVAVGCSACGKPLSIGEDTLTCECTVWTVR